MSNYYLDQKKFTFLYLALVFSLGPICSDFLKTITKCTRCTWDGLLIDLASEGAKAVVYIYLSDYHSEATVAFVRIVSFQACIIIGNFLCETYYSRLHPEWQFPPRKQEEEGKHEEDLECQRKCQFECA